MPPDRAFADGGGHPENLGSVFTHIKFSKPSCCPATFSRLSSQKNLVCAGRERLSFSRQDPEKWQLDRGLGRGVSLGPGAAAGL